MPRLQRCACAGAGGDERDDGDCGDRGGQDRGLRPRSREDDEADGAHDRDRERDPEPARGEVAQDVPEVVDDVDRRTELRAAAGPEADLEPRREHEVRPPERPGEHDDGAERDQRRAQRQRPPNAEHGDVRDLRAEDEHAVGLRREERERRRRPGRPAAARAPLQRAEEEEKRERAREEEEAVHPPVDAVIEGRPARRGHDGCEQGRPAVGQSGHDRRSHGNAPDGEGDRDQPQARQARVDLSRQVGEEIVERGAASLAEDGLEHLAEASVADEEREDFVLVRRQRVEAREQERAEPDGDRGDPEPEAVAGPREGSAAPGRGWHSGVASAGSPRPPC